MNVLEIYMYVRLSKIQNYHFWHRERVAEVEDNMALGLLRFFMHQSVDADDWRYESKEVDLKS